MVLRIVINVFLWLEIVGREGCLAPYNNNKLYFSHTNRVESFISVSSVYWAGDLWVQQAATAASFKIHVPWWKGWVLWGDWINQSTALGPQHSFYGSMSFLTSSSWQTMYKVQFMWHQHKWGCQVRWKPGKEEEKVPATERRGRVYERGVGYPYARCK